MISIKALIDYDLPGLFGSERERREVLRSAWGDCGLEWHKSYLPRHFRRGAAERYGYRPRSRKYQRRKLAHGRVGKAIEQGLTPLVYSGQLRRMLTQSATIRSFPSRFTVVMQSPTYAPQRPRTDRNPPLIDEAFRLRPEEQEQLANYLAARITHHNERVRHRRRVRIG